MTEPNTPTEPNADALAAAVLACAKGFERMRASGLRRDAIVLLLHDMTRVAKRDIVKILEAGPRLASTFVTPERLKEQK